jgi:hypothetical protein
LPTRERISIEDYFSHKEIKVYVGPGGHGGERFSFNVVQKLGLVSHRLG